MSLKALQITSFACTALMVYPLGFMVAGFVLSAQRLIGDYPAGPDFFAGVVRLAFVICFLLANSRFVRRERSFRTLVGVSILVSCGLLYSLIFQGDPAFKDSAFDSPFIYVAFSYVLILFAKIFLQRRIALLKSMIADTNHGMLKV